MAKYRVELRRTEYYRRLRWSRRNRTTVCLDCGGPVQVLHVADSGWVWPSCNSCAAKAEAIEDARDFALVRLPGGDTFDGLSWADASHIGSVVAAGLIITAPVR